MYCDMETDGGKANRNTQEAVVNAYTSMYARASSVYHRLHSHMHHYTLPLFHCCRWLDARHGKYTVYSNYEC